MNELEKSKDLQVLIKNLKEEDKKPKTLNLDDDKNTSDINSSAFNEVDYAAMLINTHIRMAVRDLAWDLTFNNQIISDLRTIIMSDDSDSSQRVVSKLFVKYQGQNFDRIKEKLDTYYSLKDRENINHYLGILNKRIKKNVFTNTLEGYRQDSDIDKVISRIDKLNDNIFNSIIPFITLDSLQLKDIKESFQEGNKLKSSVNKLNSISYYKALLKGQLVVVAAPPGTGKSQFLINETYFHASQGYKVAYLAMGDSLTSDFTIKLGCIHFNCTIDEFIDTIEVKYKDEGFQKILKNIHLSVVSAGEINSGDARRVYSNDNDLNNCDVFIFDYDSNFEELSSCEMYVAHDKIYNNVYALARSPKPKLVYIASQVKTQYFNYELIPLDALAESNRKSAIADYVVTISGLRSENLNCGIINIVKARRGRLGSTPYKLERSGKIKEISLDDYKSIKSQIWDRSNTDIDPELNVKWSNHG